jgi:ribosomal protein L29
MTFKELKDKPKEELKLMLKDEHEKLRDLRFKLAANQLKNVREVRKVKKMIAWINTLLISN